MENNVVTVKDVLQSTYRELKSINVPACVGPTGMLGLCVPIANAMRNIEACLNAIQDDDRKQEESNEVPMITTSAEESEGEEADG